MSIDQSNWPREVYSTEQVRSFDRYAIDELKIDGFELMRRAGAEALAFLSARWPEARSVVIVCGAGNNAGDGYVLAALAIDRGLAARIIAVVDPEKLSGDAARALELARKAGVAIAESLPKSLPGDADLLVDALLGTGMTRDVDGPIAAAVEQINRDPRPVLALDIPTGIDGDSGRVCGIAVSADATVTFVGLKAGLYLGEGPAYRGSLAFSALDLPAQVYADAKPVLVRLDQSDCRPLLRPRSRTSHKGLNGRVLIVGGAAGMAGAARLAAEAALRAGAGLVNAAVSPGSVEIVMADRPEIMCLGVSDAAEVIALTKQADVVVVGPGLGRDTWGRAIAKALLGIEKPLLVDADALNYLAGHRLSRGQWVLTPHPAEAGRLLAISTRQVQAAREQAVRALALEYGAVAVLKGACSLVAEVADENKVSVSVCDYGNPGMATGGTGDVLAGLIGGLIAQFGFSRQVVEMGVMIHALAGDDAAADGERGMIATDLLAPIRRRVNLL